MLLLELLLIRDHHLRVVIIITQRYHIFIMLCLAILTNHLLKHVSEIGGNRPTQNRRSTHYLITILIIMIMTPE